MEAVEGTHLASSLGFSADAHDACASEAPRARIAPHSKRVVQAVCLDGDVTMAMKMFISNELPVAMSRLDRGDNFNVPARWSEHRLKPANSSLPHGTESFSGFFATRPQLSCFFSKRSLQVEVPDASPPFALLSRCSRGYEVQALGKLGKVIFTVPPYSTELGRDPFSGVSPHQEFCSLRVMAGSGSLVFSCFREILRQAAF